MNTLPDVIIQNIQTFLLFDDYHYFLNASQEILGELKRKTIYFNLNQKWSNKYVQDFQFQRLVLSKVEDGWSQIAVRPASLFAIIEIPHGLPIHKVITSHSCKLPVNQWNNFKSIKCNYNAWDSEIPPLFNVREAEIQVTGITIDLTPFKSLSVLSVAFTRHVSSSVKGIEAIAEIPDLTIANFENVTDFSMLTSQRTLRIDECPGLTDVTCFTDICKLVLSTCPNVTDVSALNGVYDLGIYHCTGVKDISRLGNHYRISLVDLNKDITDFDCLLHIPHVSLSECSIKDVNVLQYAKSVSIYDCEDIVELSPLRNVKKIHITAQRKLIGLEELGEVSDLTIILDETIIDDERISYLKNRRLKLTNLNVTGLSIFSKMIRHLTIIESNVFAEFIHQGQGSLLKHLISLNLERSYIESLQGLEDIPVIRLSFCFALRTVKGLGRNRCVELRYCDELRDVCSLATVPIVKIVACRSLYEKKCECLKNVPRLKILERDRTF